MRLLHWSFPVWLAAGPCAWAADEPTEAIQRAGLAYQEGRYEDAVEAYASLVAQGVGSGEVLYNLGNACYRQGRLGEAILSWRRAALSLPRDPDVRANLEQARGKVKDRLDPAPSVSPFLFWLGSFTVGESTVLGSLLIGVAFLLLTWRNAFRDRRCDIPQVVPVRGIAASASLLGVLAWGGAWLAEREMAASPVAVVLTAEVTARSTVGQGGVDLFLLHEGAEVASEVLDGDWVLVRLPDGRKGWVPRASVGFVGLAPSPT